MQENEPSPRYRWPLDVLIRRLLDPFFARRFRRRQEKLRLSAHVNPLMIAVCDADSEYVKRWRKHAADCRSCSFLFRYFGISL